MEPYIGQIIMFAGNFAPRGWSLCNGQIIDIASHTALFSLLGTNYGGDGRSTMGLPDLRGRVPVHQGDGPGLSPVSLGEKGGNATTTLNINNLPSHTHAATVTNALRIAVTAENANTDDPEGSIMAAGLNTYTSGAATGEMNATAIAGSLSVDNSNTGNSQSFNNMQPYQAVNYIIAMTGVYPSRS